MKFAARSILLSLLLITYSDLTWGGETVKVTGKITAIDLDERRLVIVPANSKQKIVFLATIGGDQAAICRRVATQHKRCAASVVVKVDTSQQTAVTTCHHFVVINDDVVPTGLYLFEKGAYPRWHLFLMKHNSPDLLLCPKRSRD